MAITLLAIAVTLSACASSIDYVTGRATLNHYQLEEDVELGTKMSTLLLASAEALGMCVDPDDIYTRTVRTVAARILSVPENRARMPPVPWETRVLGAADADAWSFPGGQLVVATGLLQSGLVRDEHELAAIIGHEIAHVAARHGTEKRTKEELKKTMAPLGAFFGTRLVELANPRAPREAIEALSADAGDFDRAQEIEADIIGMEMMARAGYDARRAPEVWARLARERGVSGYASTHPAFEDRAAQLEKHLPAVEYLLSRQLSRPSTELTGWTWSSDQLGLPAVKLTADPRGAQFPSYLEARQVLDVRIQIEDGVARGAIRASRDLYEDNLWLTVRLYSAGRETQTSAPLSHYVSPQLSSRTQTQITVRATVGALEASSIEREAAGER